MDSITSSFQWTLFCSLTAHQLHMYTSSKSPCFRSCGVSAVRSWYISIYNFLYLRQDIGLGEVGADVICDLRSLLYLPRPLLLCQA